MRIGVVTIVSYNYGNRLQNYALQTYLQDAGHEVLTIRNIKGIERRFTASGNLKRLIYGVLGFFANKVRLLDGYKKFRFESFNKKHISFYKPYISDFSTLKDNAFDLAIVGSDQVWNPNYAGEIEFLHFMPHKKRAMYSVSFGTSVFEAKFKEKLQFELQHYCGISVREADAAQMLAELGLSNVQCHIDPTLLLTADAWKNLASSPKMKLPKNYALAYFLGTQDADLEHTKQYCAKHGIELLILGSHADDLMKTIDPCEFIWLIDHANFIVTDSFHGTVFSVLLHKPFWTLERKEQQATHSMNSRLTTLLNTLHLENRLVSELPATAEKRPDYDCVDEIIGIERQKAKNYLTNLLQACETDLTK